MFLMLKKSARQAEYFSPWTLSGELPLGAKNEDWLSLEIEAADQPRCSYWCSKVARKNQLQTIKSQQRCWATASTSDYAKKETHMPILEFKPALISGMIPCLIN